MGEHCLHCWCQSGNAASVALGLKCAGRDRQPVFVDVGTVSRAQPSLLTRTLRCILR